MESDKVKFNSINNTNDFIKVDNDKILNINFIRWIQKKDECFYICSKMDGCRIEDTQSVCKITNSQTYCKLFNLFN
jgi:hypothetical protein